MPESLSMVGAGSPGFPVSSYLSNYLRPTFKDALRIWWAFFWQTTLISAILAAAIEFGMLGVVYEHRNIRGNLIGPIVWFMPYVISYVVAFFIIEYILHKRFPHFRIGLVSSGSNFTSQAFPRHSRSHCASLVDLFVAKRHLASHYFFRCFNSDWRVTRNLHANAGGASRCTDLSDHRYRCGGWAVRLLREYPR